MDIVEATASYERWLRKRTIVVERDLKAKHLAMAQAPVSLFRATFYRWMQLWREHAGELADAPNVLAVGDLHVENFGTWRDAEGRLIWGVNDFDEAYPLPFTIDLVRLATSVHLAIDDADLSTPKKLVSDAILKGYVQGLEAGGRPFVLSERNTWLWRIATGVRRDPKQFWRNQEAKCTPPRKPPPPGLSRVVRGMLPKDARGVRLFHRSAGKGSLGRQRFLFRVDWKGGTTAREAKPLVPSACVWADDGNDAAVHYRDIVARAVRAPDPFFRLWGGWAIRRLAPDCSKLELAHLEKGQDESKLLWAMGFETANVHLGTASAARRILPFVRSLDPRWLDRASRQMAGVVE